VQVPALEIADVFEGLHEGGFWNARPGGLTDIRQRRRQGKASDRSAGEFRRTRQRAALARQSAIRRGRGKREGGGGSVYIRSRFLSARGCPRVFQKSMPEIFPPISMARLGGGVVAVFLYSYDLELQRQIAAGKNFSNDFQWLGLGRDAPLDRRQNPLAYQLHSCHGERLSEPRGEPHRWRAGPFCEAQPGRATCSKDQPLNG